MERSTLSKSKLRPWVILSEGNQLEAKVTQVINKALKTPKRSHAWGWDLMPTSESSLIYESFVGHRGGDALMTWSPLCPSLPEARCLAVLLIISERKEHCSLGVTAVTLRWQCSKLAPWLGVWGHSAGSSSDEWFDEKGGGLLRRKRSRHQS